MGVQVSKGTVDIGGRVKGLRERLGLSQEQLAARSGGLDRREISKIETGGNKVSSWEMRTQLAAGFGLRVEDLSNLVDGKLSVADAAKLARVS